MIDLQSQIILKELFARKQFVQIPLIQRDYAQGRVSEQEVRTEFINSLYDALQLQEDDDSLPLNLDFIYGSVDESEASRFLPLDGQQRLTTLFLLHWYLAWKDNEWEMFKDIFVLNGKSRFSYHVRPSSKEFFDALVKFNPLDPPDSVTSMSILLTDQPWYFRNWRLDPTIQSTLNMLDALHVRFKASSGLFKRLTNGNKPAITFQVLDLKDFGLSDDLYIKMNARGKPLTPFETFTARYEQVLTELYDTQTRRIEGQEVLIPEFFSRRMDTKWADFFWPYRNPDTMVFDEAVMNLFRTVIVISRLPTHKSYDPDVTRLRSKWQKSAFSFFHEKGFLDKEFSDLLIVLLEAWSGGGNHFHSQLPDGRYFDEEAIFSKAVQEPTSLGYEDLVLFRAYALYLRHHGENIDAAEFQNWMRIVFNLTVNTDYNRTNDLQRSIAGLQVLKEEMRDILEYFANEEKPVTGYSIPQITEEITKAQLIVADGSWKSIIELAEGHGYFRGQIGFLLDYSGINEAIKETPISEWEVEAHHKLQNQLNVYYQKADLMFSPKGLIDIGEYRWERALLCIGNYLQSIRRNFSFGTNSPTDQASWKRMLRGGLITPSESRRIIGELLSRLQLSEDIASQLDSIIKSASGSEPWREAFIHTPQAIEYCTRRLIRYSNGSIYLLQTSQMNGAHAELFTYCFYEKELTRLNNQLKLWPFNEFYYHNSINTDDEPGIHLNYNSEDGTLELSIRFVNNTFTVRVGGDLLSSMQPFSDNLLETLDFHNVGDVLLRSADTASISDIIVNIATILLDVTGLGNGSE